MVSVACNSVRFEVILVGDYEDQCYVGCDTILITREVPVAAEPAVFIISVPHISWYYIP
jgi:hypothetical protein